MNLLGPCVVCGNMTIGDICLYCRVIIEEWNLDLQDYL